MTKREAEKLYKQEILPGLKEQYPTDKTAWRTDWNMWTDGLCKNGEITQKQYNDWDYPAYLK